MTGPGQANLKARFTALGNATIVVIALAAGVLFPASAHGDDHALFNGATSTDPAHDVTVPVPPLLGAVVVSGESSNGDRQPLDSASMAQLQTVQTALAFHLKLAEGVDVEVVDGSLVGQGLDAAKVAAVQQLIDSEGLAVDHLFELSSKELAKLQDRAEQRSGNKQATLSLWFRLTRAEPGDASMMIAALGALDQVEVAFAEPTLASAAIAPLQYTSDGTTLGQLYLEPAPNGIGISNLWNLPGGRGENVTIFDIEQAWNTDHEDLALISDAAVLNGTPMQPAPNPAHGTAVAGVLWATDNDIGVTGIVPESKPGLVNVFTTSGIRLTNAILLAGQNLQPGDVALIEQQVCPGALSGSSCPAGWLPVEYVGSYHDAIKTIVDAGVIVIEAAGNGSRDVNSVLRRPSPGAIMVGAGNAPGCLDFGDEPPRGRLFFSNYGARVDLQAHGGCVRTTGTLAGGLGPTTNSSYTDHFSGTSSASAIVAGGAASLSSIAKAEDIVLDSADMLELLRSTGQGQSESGLGGSIGPQPDVWAASQKMLEGIQDRVPANDNYFSPHTLGPLPLRYEQTTQGATIQAGEPQSSCAQLGETIWFELPAGVGGTVRLTTAQSDFDAAVVLWRQASDTELAFVDCSAPDADDAGNDLVVDLVPGTRYRLQIGSPTARSGQLIVSIRSQGSCDLNADGFGDTVLAMPDAQVGGSSAAGKVAVAFGAPVPRGGSPLELSQDTENVAGMAEANDAFGAAWTCADVNNDSIDDLVVGAPGEGIGRASGAGGVHVFFGAATDPLSSNVFLSQSTRGVPGNSESNDGFGGSLAVGDLNGDGLTELVVGAPGEGIGRRSNAGALTVFDGSTTGDISAHLWYQNTSGVHGVAETGDMFGASLVIGDLNGDGIDDLVVGAPGEGLGSTSGVGMLHIFRGSDQGVRPVDFVLGIDAAQGANQMFGTALAVGDTDADGLDELLVGAPGTRQGRSWAYAYGQDASGVLRFVGPVSGGALSADPASGFGSHVAVGDVDGDGIAESFVAAPGASAVAYRSATQSSEFSTEQLGLTDAVLGAGMQLNDLDGDGYTDLVMSIIDDAGEMQLLVVPGASGGLALERTYTLGV